jgi:hypothetical protein
MYKECLKNTKILFVAACGVIDNVNPVVTGVMLLLATAVVVCA